MRGARRAVGSVEGLPAEGVALFDAAPEVVCHALELEHGVDVFQFDGGWDLNTGGGVVENRANAAASQDVDDVLGVRSGNRDNADLGVVFAEVGFEVGDVTDGVAVDVGANDLGVGVIAGDDIEALALEAGVGGDRATEASNADDDNAPAAVETEDVAEFVEQSLYGVAATLFAEATEIGEVFANLRGGYA